MAEALALLARRSCQRRSDKVAAIAALPGRYFAVPDSPLA